MNEKSAIEINSISKVYKLYSAHRDRMKEVGKGEVLGIIGQNGSGKSTLLKILASVVTPTSGSFRCNGRVSALLELGGGFNMELTGVENVMFLGAIQGYSKKEMKMRLEDILDFAEIGEYAYQPVKNYSSGMYIRLAFSMNININPEILIVDEALAVGDIRFQQKCFRKIREIKESGKTIVMCSHSLGAVKDFCTQALWIHNGSMMKYGDPVAVTETYQSFMSQQDAKTADSGQPGTADLHASLPRILEDAKYRNIRWSEVGKMSSGGSRKAVITHAAIISAPAVENLMTLEGGEQVRVAMIVRAEQDMINPMAQLTLNGKFSAEILSLNNHHFQQPLKIRAGTAAIVIFRFKFPLLVNGNYAVSLSISDVIDGNIQLFHSIHEAMMIGVNNPDPRFDSSGQIVLEDAGVFALIENEEEPPKTYGA